MQKKFHYIDLFAGCGGLSLGLCNAGWTGLFAIEKSADAFETLKHNLIDKGTHFQWVDWLPKRHYSIQYVLRTYRKELERLRGKIDLVAGGPPCQGFSMAGRREEGDKRNELVKSYIKFVKIVQPKIIFFENVRGFTQEFKKNSEKGLIYSSYVTRRLESAGYIVRGELVNFGDYGIPQNRTRFVLVGIRKDLRGASKEKAERFFVNLRDHRMRFLRDKRLPLFPKLSQAISDLHSTHGTSESADSKGFVAGSYGSVSGLYQRYMRKFARRSKPDSHRFANHTKEVRKRLRRIIESSIRNKTLCPTLRNEWKLKKHRIVLLDGASQSRTLTSNPDDLVHYSEARSLTVREYARIQSFPDWYEIKGKYTSGGLRRRVDVPRFTQVGNSIPPLFGEQSGLILKSLL